MAKILVVDDEAAIRLTMAAILSRDGHQVLTAENGQTALELIMSQAFELALIDLKLGDIAGTEVLAALRQQSPDTVAIMLTAQASLETAVEALRHGAHDYLFKPCQTAELRESIRRGLLKHQKEKQQHDLLRQLEQSLADNLKNLRTFIVEPTDLAIAAPTAGEFAEEQGRFLQQGRLILDFLRHIATLDDHLLALSPTEFNLLAYLLRAVPRVVSAQELVREIHGYDSEPWSASETVRTHIYHLRQKIKEATGHTNVIRTIRGVGYTIGE
jgi:DNA-binding response OmpR family regulator